MVKYDSEIDKICEDIEKKKKLKKKSTDDLKCSSKNDCYGYLVKKEWFDDWIKYTNYEEIKKNFLDNNSNKNSIKNKIIYFKEKEKNKYSKLEISNIKNILIKRKSLSLSLKIKPLLY